MEDKLQTLECLFVRYGALPTDLDRENREHFGDRIIYSCGGSYFRAGTARFDGQDYLVISSIDMQKYARLGVLEDIDVLPMDCPEERLEKAVRYALGVEPYPEIYPEQE